MKRNQHSSVINMKRLFKDSSRATEPCLSSSWESRSLLPVEGLQLIGPRSRVTSAPLQDPPGFPRTVTASFFYSMGLRRAVGGLDSQLITLETSLSGVFTHTLPQPPGDCGPGSAALLPSASFSVMSSDLRLLPRTDAGGGRRSSSSPWFWSPLVWSSRCLLGSSEAATACY